MRAPLTCHVFHATLIQPVAVDLVRFLLEHAPRGALGPMANRSLEDLGLVLDPSTTEPRGVLCCDDATPALDAFG